MPTPDLLSTKELRGLALPATKGPGGYFESKSPSDTAWGDLMLALFTPIGGRFMRRSLGSALYEHLFEPVVENDFPLVDYAIREAADRQLQNVRIDATEIKEVPRGLEIRVRFRLRGDLSNAQSATVQVPKTFVGGV